MDLGDKWRIQWSCREDLSRKHKITQKLVFMFYIYCNIEYRTSTTLIIHYDIISSALDAFEHTISSF